MSNQLSISKVRAIVESATLGKRFQISVKPEAHEACCVEIHDAEWGNLVWRKRSYEPDFESELERQLDKRS
ncbi:hypothetical protein WE348_22855 (plasmid) [Alteromonas macleodii]|uniref:hypothetical protein n=1 Tax=Alteromonas macleodii TaxID=28108 RepID=UPI0030CFB235